MCIYEERVINHKIKNYQFMGPATPIYEGGLNLKVQHLNTSTYLLKNKYLIKSRNTTY
jgi:hypothetical protein